MATAHAAHDHHHADPSGWRRYVYSTNHKDIGTMYLWFSIMAGVIGGILSIFMRMELQEPGIQIFHGLASMVYGFEGDAGLQLAGGKRMVDLAPAGEGRVVGDQCLVRQVIQADAFLLCQRVVVGHDQHVLPFVAGQGDQIGVVGQRFRGHADLGHFVNHHARHLVRCGLVQADVDLGIRLA